MSFRKLCHMPFRKLIPPFTLTVPTHVIRKKRIFLRFMRLKDENSKKIGDKSNLELFTKLLILEIALFNMTAVA